MRVLIEASLFVCLMFLSFVILLEMPHFLGFIVGNVSENTLQTGVLWSKELI